MKTALLVHSFAGANETVKRHWEFYKRSGFDIFGVGRTNTVCVWPESMRTKDIGVDAYIDGDNLPRRLVDTFDWFLRDEIFQCYTHCCVIEYDGIFLSAPPPVEVVAAAHLAGGKYPGFTSNQFHHCPWWLDRESAGKFVEQGRLMIGRGDIEKGSPDFFFSLAMEQAGIPVKHLEGTYSRNSLDIAEDRKQCQTLIRAKLLWFVHGVKTQEQLEEILS